MIRDVIVDDEPTTENVIRYFADRGDLPVEIVGAANNGRTGISVIREKKPDIVFMDVQMPVMNGLEVMAEYPDARFVVITAYDSFSYAQEALRLGAADILLKPIEISQLIKAVERATGWNFTGNTTVDEIVKYIREHYTEDISLTQLADRFFLSPSYLARLFRKHMGESLLSYLHHVRIEKARALIDDGMGIREAAELTGYNSLNNFYKYFKRYYRVTPAAYTKSGKNE